MSRPVILVVGAGPGVSGSVARRFADEGYDVGLLGQDQAVLDDLVPDLEQRGATVGHAVVDVTDTTAARDAVRRIGEHAGRIDVLHFNPSAYRAKDPLDAHRRPSCSRTWHWASAPCSPSRRLLDPS